jgi:thiol-disulfide isomerase/thioredoxin
MTRYLYFTAPWCGPCKIVRPKVEAWGEGEDLTIVSVDDSPDTAQEHQVTSVPQLLTLDDSGQEVHRAIGIIDIRKVIDGSSD